MLTAIPVDDPSDPRLADYTRLTDVSLRTSLEAEHGLFIAEGTKVISRAVRAGYPVRSMLLAQSRAGDLEGLFTRGGDPPVDPPAQGGRPPDTPPPGGTRHKSAGPPGPPAYRAEEDRRVPYALSPTGPAGSPDLPAYRAGGSPAADDAPVYVVPDAVAESLTGYRVHRGALAAMGRVELPSVAAVLAGARRVVILEDLVDHGNVGAIFRCAAALGVDAVIVSPRCADPLYRRSVKVSMGAVFAIPYARMTDWYDGLAEIRAAGFTVLALTPDERATPVATALGRLAVGRVGLLLGTEGDGLSSRWLHEADESVRIPMDPGARAAGVDSLNVVAAAAIACSLLAERIYSD